MAENPEPTNPLITEPKTNKVFYIWILVGVVILALPGFFIVNRKSQTSQQMKEIKKDSTGKTGTSLMTLGAFKMAFPKDWKANISSQTKIYFSGRFSYPSDNPAVNYVEIEMTDTAKIIKNPLLKLKQGSQQKKGALTMTISEGTETFVKSARYVKQMQASSVTQTLVITVYAKNAQSKYSKTADILMNSLSEAGKMPISMNIIGQVQAADSIAGIDTAKFIEVPVMGETMNEQITQKDASYLTGYAKFYTFFAFNGQRLTTALEASKPDMLLRSELYDEQGQQLYSKDTRIEYDAPYTGQYYLIVYVDNRQEGYYKFRIFDRSQTENLVYAKYDDGSEMLIDYNKPAPIYGENPIAFIMQFANPVTADETGKITYVDPPHEFNQGRGTVHSQINVNMNTQTYSEFSHATAVEAPERNQRFAVPIKMTPMSQSKVLIEQKDGTEFPSKHHIAVSEKDDQIDDVIARIFTYDTAGETTIPTASPEASVTGVQTKNDCVLPNLDIPSGYKDQTPINSFFGTMAIAGQGTVCRMLLGPTYKAQHEGFTGEMIQISMYAISPDTDRSKLDALKKDPQVTPMPHYIIDNPSINAYRFSRDSYGGRDQVVIFEKYNSVYEIIWRSETHDIEDAVKALVAQM